MIAYTQTIGLKHNEVAAKVNLETGEVSPVMSKVNNIPADKEVFEPEGIFRKDYTKSWIFLDKVLTPLEFKVVAKLCRMAKMNTNSLEPLNDETTINQIAEEFNLNRRIVTPLFKKLFNLGVFAKFDVVKKDIPHTKYWVLNPYLSFGGRLIFSDIANMFKGTEIEIEYNKK